MDAAAQPALPDSWSLRSFVPVAAARMGRSAAGAVGAAPGGAGAVAGIVDPVIVEGHRGWPSRCPGLVPCGLGRGLLACRAFRWQLVPALAVQAADRCMDLGADCTGLAGQEPVRPQRRDAQLARETCWRMAERDESLEAQARAAGRAPAGGEGGRGDGHQLPGLDGANSLRWLTGAGRAGVQQVMDRGRAHSSGAGDGAVGRSPAP